MTAEFARKRIVEIRNDYSKDNLNNKLGFNYNRENKSGDELTSWIEIR